MKEHNSQPRMQERYVTIHVRGSSPESRPCGVEKRAPCIGMLVDGDR